MPKPPPFVAAVTVALAFLAVTPAHADSHDFGGEVALGLGIAGGDTRGRHDGATGRAMTNEAGGIVLDLSPRLWWGPLVVSATGMTTPGLLTAAERAAVVGAGVRAELTSATHVLALAEAGRHQIAAEDVAPGFNSKVTLPCWAARLIFESRSDEPTRGGMGVGLFMIRDLDQVDMAAGGEGLLAEHEDRFRTGGYLFGLLFQASLGS